MWPAQGQRKQPQLVGIKKLSADKGLPVAEFIEKPLGDCFGVG